MKTFPGLFKPAAALLTALSLLGCAGASNDFASSLMVSPGMFNAYDCTQLDQTARGLRARITEMEQLMARSSGGELVNAISYRSEYEYTRGQYNEVVRTAANKNCSSQSK